MRPPPAYDPCALPLPASSSSAARGMAPPLYNPPAFQRARRGVQCCFSLPTRVMLGVVLMAAFLWLLRAPLFQLRVVHARVLPVAAAAGLMPVLVTHEHDLAEVETWTALSHALHHQRQMPHADDPSTHAAAKAPYGCYGVHAQRGRRRHMEDTYAVYLQHELHYSSSSERHLVSVDTEPGEARAVSPWALFAVYDGHGGALASEYAAASLLPSLHSSLLHHGHSGAAPPLPTALLDPASSALNVSRCFERAFEELDEEFIRLVARPAGREDGSTALVAGVYYRGRPLDSCPPQASGDAVSHQSPFQLVVANLGDCRAVLIRPPTQVTHPPSDRSLAPAAVTSAAPLVTPLSIDHKPHLASERAFIESHPAGFVTQRGAMSRVQGVLATSRAIGDYPLKPIVRNTPQVVVIDLDEPMFADEEEEAAAIPPHHTIPECDSALPPPLASDLLLLASDGFWDRFSNTEAGEFVLRFLSSPPPPAPSSSSSSAAPSLLSSLAHHLAREAYLRGSMDNISVMVVHLECIKQWIRNKIRKGEA